MKLSMCYSLFSSIRINSRRMIIISFPLLDIAVFSRNICSEVVKQMVDY